MYWDIILVCRNVLIDVLQSIETCQDESEDVFKLAQQINPYPLFCWDRRQWRDVLTEACTVEEDIAVTVQAMIATRG